MRKLLLFTTGFALSCFTFGLLSDSRLLLGTLIGFAAFAALGMVFFPSMRRRLTAVLLGIGVGILWCALYAACVIGPAASLSGQKRALHGEVVSFSVTRSNAISAEVKLTDGENVAKASVYFYRCEQELLPGDRITGVFSLRPARDEDLDGLLFAGAGGIVLTGYGTLDTLRRPNKAPIRYLPQFAARAIRNSLYRLFPKDAAGFLSALLTADRSGLSIGAKADLSAAGVSHVIAISGMHVSILVSFFYLVFGRGNRLLGFFLILTLVFFVLMTGGSPSVSRAAVMHVLLFLAFHLKREADAPTSLSAAALLILLWNPYAILQISFLLSFGAVAGMLLITQPLYRCFAAVPFMRTALGWKWKKKGYLPYFANRLIHRAVQLIPASTAATLGALLFTTPVVAYAFGTFSVYTVLANTLILWAVSVCFAGGMLTALTGLVSLNLGGILAAVITVPVRYILWVAHWVSRLPCAVLSMRGVYGIAFLSFSYLVILGAFLLREKRYFRPLSAILCGLLAALCFTRLDLRRRTFTAAALDVGEGQCICMITPDYSTVIDCGGESGYRTGQHAAEYLRASGLDAVDQLILTHYDTDHINGVVSLMQGIPVRALYLPDVPFDPKNRLLVEQAAAECGVPVWYVTEDLQLEFPGGQVRIFAPVSMRDDNAASLAAMLQAADFRMLVTGDMDLVSEYDLIRTHSLPDVDLYIAGHHGSKTSSSAELLQQILPETVFISVGDNTYGHPTQEALDRFADVGAAVFRTDQCGDIEIGR